MTYSSLSCSPLISAAGGVIEHENRFSVTITGSYAGTTRSMRSEVVVLTQDGFPVIAMLCPAFFDEMFKLTNISFLAE